jgi:HAD superfamily phosphatase
MQTAPLLILDMDGVLVDVGDSYREVIRNSVVLYLREFIGAEINEGEFIKPRDVARIKQGGGLNNDWELTYAIIDAILKHYFDDKNPDLCDPFITLEKETHDNKLLRACRDILKRADRSLLESQIGKSSIVKIYFEERERSSSPFLMNRNDVGSGNLVKRIFQEIYLGEQLFRKLYRANPIFYGGRGYIGHERLIPSMDQLESLGRLCTLAIATGRPYAEAEFALNKFAIKSFFSVLVTEDDVQRAEETTNEKLRKPHPYMIESCMERSGYKEGKAVMYMGDMPDDIEAAIRAGVLPFGFVYGGEDAASDEIKAHRELLIEKGAMKVFGDYDELAGFLKVKSTWV